MHFREPTLIAAAEGGLVGPVCGMSVSGVTSEKTFLRLYLVLFCWLGSGFSITCAPAAVSLEHCPLLTSCQGNNSALPM